MNRRTSSDVPPRRQLSLFDVTNLVLGAIVGADIYIVAGPGARLLGPAILAVWLGGGILSACIALCFARCATLDPQVGGTYAYVHRAFGAFPGFMVGWVLYLTQWAGLAVFPVAFVLYLGYLFPGLTSWQAAGAKVLFMAFVLASNLASVRTAGRTNDILTLAKLAPLLLFVLAGLGYLLLRPTMPVHLTPFAPFGWSGFAPGLVLVYFAYTGVEFAVLPAGEIVRPAQTLPRAILLGVALSTACYLLVSLVTVSVVPSTALAQSSAPLALAAETLAQGLGLAAPLAGLLMTAGALLSIVGTAEVINLCIARLSYAMALDGLFPSFFARLHPRLGTPYLGLLFQNGTALVAALVSDLLPLITISVFCASLVYLGTSLAAWRLSPPGAGRIPQAGVLASLILLLAAAPQVSLTGIAIVITGAIAYLILAHSRRS